MEGFRKLPDSWDDVVPLDSREMRKTEFRLIAYDSQYYPVRPRIHIKEPEPEPIDENQPFYPFFKIILDFNRNLNGREDDEGRFLFEAFRIYNTVQHQVPWAIANNYNELDELYRVHLGTCGENKILSIIYSLVNSFGVPSAISGERIEAEGEFEPKEWWHIKYRNGLEVEWNTEQISRYGAHNLANTQFDDYAFDGWKREMVVTDVAVYSPYSDKYYTTLFGNDNQFIWRGKLRPEKGAGEGGLWNVFEIRNSKE